MQTKTLNLICLHGRAPKETFQELCTTPHAQNVFSWGEDLLHHQISTTKFMKVWTWFLDKQGIGNPTKEEL